MIHGTVALNVTVATFLFYDLAPPVCCPIYPKIGFISCGHFQGRTLFQ
jgi:predicted GNAT family acetyltransferase